MIDYDNMNYKNNVDKEKIQIKILSKTDYSLSIKAFPNENDFMNIIFIYESGFKTNIIIPPNKHISELFNIFAKINEFELNKLYFMSYLYILDFINIFINFIIFIIIF